MSARQVDGVRSSASVASKTGPRGRLSVVANERRGAVPAPRVRGHALVLTLGALGVGAIIAGVLLEQVILAESAFKLSRLRQRLVAVQERHEALVMEVAELENPERIERYARVNLGMREPATVRYIAADVPPRLRTRFTRSTSELLAGARVAVGGAVVANGP